jgi:hypothetical protein
MLYYTILLGMFYAHIVGLVKATKLIKMHGVSNLKVAYLNMPKLPLLFGIL